MLRVSIGALALASAIAGATLLAAAHAASLPATGEGGGWTSYRNDRYGFSLNFPAEVFVEGETRNREQGALWVSRDRQARLIAVATRNETGETLQSYRSFLIETTYKGASFDYAPQRDNWFVLSGVQNGQVFYERIVFACEGRYIYGWQMRYPLARKRLYDLVVERVHRSYEAGRGEDGKCG